MEAAEITPAYEVLRDARVDANERELAIRLREAGFDPEFASGLFPSRADSSIKSSADPTVAQKIRRRRSHSVESDFQPRRSSRAKQALKYSNAAEETQPKARNRSYAVSIKILKLSHGVFFVSTNCLVTQEDRSRLKYSMHD